MEDRKPHRKTRVGTVVSNKMDKTISVQVLRYSVHPIYEKRIVKSKKYLAHDEENTCRIGDEVLIGEVSPLSKHKCWSVMEIIKRAPVLGSPSAPDKGEED